MIRILILIGLKLRVSLFRVVHKKAAIIVYTIIALLPSIFIPIIWHYSLDRYAGIGLIIGFGVSSVMMVIIWIFVAVRKK